MALFEDLKVFSGNAHPKLARSICSYLGMTIGDSEAFKFNNDNTFVRFKENIREKDVFLVQPVSSPVNDHLMELFIMMDAARRASAGRITAVIPYYAYTAQPAPPRQKLRGGHLRRLRTVPNRPCSSIALLARPPYFVDLCETA